jgi:hypothetical protein
LILVGILASPTMLRSSSALLSASKSLLRQCAHSHDEFEMRRFLRFSASDVRGFWVLPSSKVLSLFCGFVQPGGTRFEARHKLTPKNYFGTELQMPMIDGDQVINARWVCRNY